MSNDYEKTFENYYAKGFNNFLFSFRNRVVIWFFNDPASSSDVFCVYFFLTCAYFRPCSYCSSFMSLNTCTS